MAEETVDVLIVGAGAAGAALAWSLAETRMNIVCLEQGDWMDPGHDLSETTSQFLNNFADEMVPLIPVLRNLNIIRQWTGICDRTPDDKPAVGRLDDGLYVTCGYHDYGITVVPAVGRLMAETIASGETSPMLRPFDPLRFG